MSPAAQPGYDDHGTIRPDCIIVAGPTASGKTTLAVKLAQSLNGEILSADSRQVYRRLDIGSGKDLVEYGTVPYHLIDIADPASLYTLYHYQIDFYKWYNDISARKKLPVICGGTGLYIESVLRGYAIPAVPENVPLRTELMQEERDRLAERLENLDPQRFAMTDLKSKKRIVRALEVAIHYKEHPVELLKPDHPEIHPLLLCTRWERAVLHTRIDKRLNARFDAGMIDEVVHLRSSGVPDDRLLMLGMEYKWITRYLRGELTITDMKEQLRTSIYQLAKRQETYFRGMERRCGISIQWIDNADVAKAIECCAGSGFNPAGDNPGCAASPPQNC